MKEDNIPSYNVLCLQQKLLIASVYDVFDSFSSENDIYIQTHEVFNSRKLSVFGDILFWLKGIFRGII